MERPEAFTPLPSRLQLAPGPWATLLEGLCARFPAIPEARWEDRFARGRVQKPDGGVLAAGDPWRVGQDIVYFREVDDEATIPFMEAVLYQDAHLLVADKPHFLPVVPSGRFVRETLLTRLRQRPGCDALVPLHRIDRATAGLVLFSTNPASRAAYQALFREQRIHKRYEALAPAMHGAAFPLEHRSRLVQGEPFFRMQEVMGEPNSLTGIDVLERGEGDWRYALTPVTGRKHQLRVHMAALGVPIRNDPLYPGLGPPAVGSEDFAHPLKLLARSLAFTDPLSGAMRHFESGLSLWK
ncbi:pseudouridine synthase [Pseudoxanthomonas sp.]|uniref:pseudouridine synthase n=1 Tax=Pseudoxanthomonas sp. TaxID=1871049 RepID=UPI0026074F75|nr:pseudouridine synthase [Pseudoxanthomonas sp.]WDS37199.1 MAG: pseudouridine synthase [Pseudoxanthomonas sp.]